MMPTHKNKLLATLLAAIFGVFGAHRFYLYGPRNVLAWLSILFFPIAFLSGFIEALIIGLTADTKWDQRFNQNTNYHTQSDWKQALALVFIAGGSAIVYIAVLARITDLMLTGGAYG